MEIQDEQRRARCRMTTGRRVRCIVTTVLALGLELGAVRAGSAQPRGSLAQLPRPDACTQEGGDGINCRDGIGLDGASDVVVSPDGKNAYVAGLQSNAVTVFARNKASGVLTQLAGPSGCVADSGDGVTCQDALGLFGPSAVAVSPDNAHVYVASFASGLTVFDRDPATGALTQLPAPHGCISEWGGGASDCTDAYGPVTPTSVLVTPDGKFVYTLGLNGNAIGVYARDKATGRLTQLPAPEGCIAATGDGVTCKSAVALEGPRDIAMSKNGKHVYVAAQDSDAVLVFQRDKTTGALTQLAAPNGCVAHAGDGVTCTAGIGLEGPTAVLVAKNSRHLYVASYGSDAVTIFARQAGTGVLTQLPGPAGCHDESGDGVTCTDAVALNGPRDLAESNNGRHVYVASALSSGVAMFERDKQTGELEQLYYPNACTIATGDNVLCRPGLGLSLAGSVTVTRNGKHVYVAAFGSDAVAVFARKK